MSEVARNALQHGKGGRAQFIVDDDFAPVVLEGDFDKRTLDPAYVRQQETLVTRGYRRLRELAGLELPIIDYPLPEVRARLNELRVAPVRADMVANDAATAELTRAPLPPVSIAPKPAPARTAAMF